MDANAVGAASFQQIATHGVVVTQIRLPLTHEDVQERNFICRIAVVGNSDRTFGNKLVRRESDIKIAEVAPERSAQVGLPDHRSHVTLLLAASEDPIWVIGK